VLTVKSSGLGVPGRHTVEQALENLFVAAALGKGGFAMEVIAVAEVVAAAEDDVLEPCNAGPIPGLHLVSSLHPFRQTPSGSYTEESPHSGRFATCPVRSSFAPGAVLLA
jgi:hypothetical protein